MATTMDDHHIQSRSQVVLAVTMAMLVCATIFVVLRMISRIAIVRKVTWDDHFMILAWVIAFGFSFAICYGTSVGLGRHQKDIPDHWNSALKKAEYAVSVLYNPALMATKTSILVFYLSLSKNQQVFRWATVSTLAVVNIAGLALTILNLAQCRPVDAAFQTPVPSSAHCTDVLTLYLSSAPVNIITDLAILFLPMPILTSMRLPRKQKIILVITFGFGIFVAVVDVVRIAYLKTAATTRLQHIEDNQGTSGSDSRNSESNDYSWYVSLSFMWSAIEVDVGIMCACVPALKPLVSRFLPNMLRDNSEDVSFANTGTMGSIDLIAAERIPSAPQGTMGMPQKPPPAVAPAADSPMDMMDFLTTPGMAEIHDSTPPCERTQTMLTNTTRHTAPASPTFFDFINFKRKKSAVQMTTRESLFPVTMVTILFFIWGFAYGLLDILNAQFQAVAHMSTAQAVGLHGAYYAGYLVTPLTFGRLVLNHWGFKSCYTVGLCVYACGTLVFWPSAVLTSFPAFLVSNFIVGLGLSTLEIAANPFITICGPQCYAEVRLNLSQGVQAIGSIVSPLLAKKVLFKVQASSLSDVQWTYLGIALFTVLLAVAYYYIPLPEATDEELEDAAERADCAHLSEFRGVRIVFVTLALAVFSQFCYVGGQESVATSFSLYMARVNPSIDVTNHQAIGHTAFAVTRFGAGVMGIWIKPRWMLLGSYVGAIVFAALAMNFSGGGSAAIVIFLYFFEGPLFSLIYAQGLRGLGKHTKNGSALLTAAISGGGVWPPIMHAVASESSPQYAYCVVVAAFAFGTIFPVYLSAVPIARRQVDPIKSNADSLENTDGEDMVGSSSGSSRSSRIGRTFGSIKRRVCEKDILPTAEHREKKASSWGSGSGKEGGDKEIGPL